MWQEPTTNHTCSTAHDRVKKTPVYDIRSQNMFTRDTIEPESTQELSLDFLAELNPELFKEIVIDPMPFKSRCVKPYFNVISGGRKERIKKLKELPRLHSEYNQCKIDDIALRIEWYHI